MTTASEVLEMVDEIRDLARRFPLRYAKHFLGVTLHKRQRQFLEAFADPAHNLIAMRSGNAAGKTYALAVAGVQYSDANQPSYTIFSGASWTGVLKTLWPTVRQLVAGARISLGGEMMATEWRRGDLWSAFCVSPDVPENFSGFRTSGGVAVLMDEASALPQDVYDAILGLCSGSGSKVVLSGNPLHLEGPFHEAFRSPDFICFHVDTRDVVGLGIPGLATPEWLEQRKREWGEGSNQWAARVCGEFPKSSFDSVIPAEWLVARKLAPPRAGPLRLGVDVARYGADRSLLVVRDDSSVRARLALSKANVTHVVGAVIDYAKRHGVQDDQIFVDDCGVGGGVTDGLIDNGWAANGVNFGEGASEREQFHNRRAECYWRMRKALDPEGTQRMVIPHQFADLRREAVIARHKFDSKGRIQIEDKEEIRKRLGRSPDEADALALTFADVSGFSVSMS